MSSSIIITGLFILSISTVITKIIQVPIKFDKFGKMYTEFEKLDFYLTNNLTLIIKDDICSTIVDFTRPTDYEIQTKSGYRNVTDTCGIWIKNPAKGLRSRRPE
ncbi:hypothetical protein EWB00_006277 [Schistosoma japonicum]|uniref:Uncharacterized protein n=1 Tax=Schistosoma japonicum TaxID=6182 RepID=A0A4Z2CZC4_SCHJA|nr:hypothetical protein EWB00_006277 [Schistosoma japonicum]